MDHDKIESVLKRLKSVIRSNTRLDDTLAIEATEDLIRDLKVEIGNQETRIVDLEEALEPFATLADGFVDEHGWTSNEHRAPISTWLGPSDFRRAAAALKPKD